MVALLNSRKTISGLALKYVRGDLPLIDHDVLRELIDQAAESGITDMDLEKMQVTVEYRLERPSWGERP